MYILIAVPGMPSKVEACAEIEKTIHSSLCKKNAFSIPTLKVGSLDTLVVLSDALIKADTAVGASVSKFVTAASETISSSPSATACAPADLNADNAGQQPRLENLLSVHNMAHTQYLEQFTWDAHRFDTRLDVQTLVDIITNKASELELELRKRVQTYSQVHGQLLHMLNKEEGNLTTRSIDTYVKPFHYVADSEYLMSAFLVIEPSCSKAFLATYTDRFSMVVPESAVFITRDQEGYELWSLTLLKKFYPKFKSLCREHHLVLRDFEPISDSTSEPNSDPTATAAKDSAAAKNLSSADALAALEAKEASVWNATLRWIRLGFDQIFSAWIHLKAIRLFTESILYFGLPPNYQGYLFSFPTKKSTPKIKEFRQAMAKQFRFLNKSFSFSDAAASKDKSFSEDFELTGLNLEDYGHPYVSLTFECQYW